MSSPSISVVMPVHNGQEFLDQAIQSIRGQTLQDFELVIVDDGSNDRTPEILRQHSAADPRIRCLGQPRSGVAAALNLGIRASSGCYIARMDADDIAKPHRLSRQLEELSQNPHVAVLGSNYEVIDRFGRVLRVVRMPTSSAAIRDALRRSNCIGHPTVLMRRDVVVEAGGYRQAFGHCEDYDLWLRLGEKYELCNVNEILLLYREHRGQLTWSNLEQRIYAELAAHISARHRRAGLRDPFHNDHLVTRSFLRELEMTDLDIRSELFHRALTAAREARRARNWKFALQACALAAQNWLTPPN